MTGGPSTQRRFYGRSRLRKEGGPGGNGLGHGKPPVGEVWTMAGGSDDGTRSAADKCSNSELQVGITEGAIWSIGGIRLTR